MNNKFEPPKRTPSIASGFQDPPGYERLVAVLRGAVDQAAYGKGAERHANGRDFEKQPIILISEMLESPHGMAFQAIKKIREALEMPDPRKRIHELYGAINYVAAIVIYTEDRMREEQVHG